MEKDLAIIVLAYKEKYLRESLNSFLDQSSKHFTLYVVDDASPDNLVEVVEEFNQKLPIKYIKFENNLGRKSLVSQWDRAISCSSGEEWIWLFGDDDKCDVNCVELFQTYVADGSLDNTNVFRFATKVIDEYSVAGNTVYIHPEAESGTEFFTRKIRGLTRSSLSEYIFRRKTYCANGFPVFPLAWHSDDAAWISFASHSKIWTCNEAFVYFRVSGDSISGSQNNFTLKAKATRLYINWLLSAGKLERDKISPLTWLYTCYTLESYYTNGLVRLRPKDFALLWITRLKCVGLLHSLSIVKLLKIYLGPNRETMTISVIIPIKDRAHLIGKTLDSIFNQTNKPLEVILVDDGSQDDLRGALIPYLEKVILVMNNGSGPGAARNTGLNISTGDAIQFFDSDDLMTTNKLQVQAELLQKNSLDFVYGPYVKAEEINNRWLRKGAIMQFNRLPDKSLTDLVLQGWCLLTQSVLFNRSFLSKVGEWRVDLMSHEDWEFWSRIAKNNPRYSHENDSCIIYRQHGHQLTDIGLNSKSRRFENILASEIIEKNIAKNGSLHSKMIMFGRRANAVYHLRKDFNDPKVKTRVSDVIRRLYYLIWSRIEQARSGTEWMRFHGASNSEKHFNNYLNKLN